jgi:heme oxygenase
MKTAAEWFATYGPTRGQEMRTMLRDLRRGLTTEEEVEAFIIETIGSAFRVALDAMTAASPDRTTGDK